MPTTIKLKNSVTTTNAPSSLAQGEVAINITDKKVWVGNAATTPIQLLGAGGSASFSALTCTSLTNSGLTSGRVTYATTAGLLTDSANLTFNGTTLTAADITDSSLTATRVTYAGTGGNLVDSANLTFNGTTLTSGGYSTGGNLTFTGTGNRITGDFSNATIANRVAFQTSTTNTGSNLNLLPNGTAAGAFWNAFGNSDPTNAAFGRFGITGGNEVTIRSDITGTGTYAPLTMYTGGSERLRIDTSGNVGIGTSSPASFGKFAVLQTSGSVAAQFATTTNGAGTYIIANNSAGTDHWSYGGYANYGTTGAFHLSLSTNSAERMRITSGGDVGIGQSSPVNIAGYTIQTINNSNTGAGVYLQSNGTTIGRILNTATDFFVGGVSVSSACILQSGSAERMRITSSGDVLTGSTTTAGTTNPTAINLVGRLRSTQGQTASIANGATVDITLTYPRATVAYLIQSSVNTGNSSAGLFWSNDNGASSTFTLFGQNQNNVAVTSPAAGTIRITNNTGGTCAFNYAFTIIAGL